jgi:hypothetical protein
MPDLYRAFPWDPPASDTEPGGALYVPRQDQGFGRHDNPDLFGTMYLSRAQAAAAAEVLRMLRVTELRDADLRIEGATIALVAFAEPDGLDLVDLDDPRTLVARSLRPSGVATRDRDRTQAVSTGLFNDGHAGFEWWSTIEASWINVTLFAERAAGRLRLAGEPEPLTLDHPAVRDAAEAVGVVLAA